MPSDGLNPLEGTFCGNFAKANKTQHCHASHLRLSMTAAGCRINLIKIKNVVWRGSKRRSLIGLLLIFAPSCRFGLFLALYAGLFIMLPFAKLREHAGPGALTLESAKSHIKCFIFLDSDLSHLSSLPPQRQIAASDSRALTRCCYDKPRFITFSGLKYRKYYTSTGADCQVKF